MQNKERKEERRRKEIHQLFLFQVFPFPFLKDSKFFLFRFIFKPDHVISKIEHNLRIQDKLWEILKGSFLHLFPAFPFFFFFFSFKELLYCMFPTYKVLGFSILKVALFRFFFFYLICLRSKLS